MQFMKIILIPILAIKIGLNSPYLQMDIIKYIRTGKPILMASCGKKILI